MKTTPIHRGHELKDTSTSSVRQREFALKFSVFSYFQTVAAIIFQYFSSNHFIKHWGLDFLFIKAVLIALLLAVLFLRDFYRSFHAISITSFLHV